jgi:membrane protein
VAYDEREERSFLKLNLVTLLFTLSAMLVGILLLVGVGVVPVVLAIAGLGEQTELLVSILRWPVLFAVCWAAISVIYRYGPSRTRPKWRWIIWGSMASTAAWILGSILFSWYLQNFADYDATYGSLGAVIGLLMWTWLSLAILILGAEFNSEMEHQTRRDSTIGPETPMGTRGAVMADTVGSRYDRADARTGGGFHGRDTPVDSFAGDTRLAPDRQQPSLGYILLTGALVLVIDAFLERRKRKGHRPD